MVNHRKVIVCTPSGRKQNLEILKSYILRDMASGVVDEWHLWLNTEDKEDVAYIKELAKNKRVSIKKITFEYELSETWRQWNLHKFYQYCKEDAIYVRIDDDICYIEEESIKDLVRFKTLSPQYFNVYGNVLNNSLMSSVQMRMGNWGTNFGVAEYATYDHVALQNGNFMLMLHEQIVQDIKNNNLDKYKFGRWQLLHYEHHSVTVSCFDGNDLKEIEFSPNDEIEIAVTIPNKLGKINCVFGGGLFVHYSYYYQRRDLKQQDLDPDLYLNSYLEISNENSSNNRA